MGLSVDSTSFLVQAWKRGVRFDHTLTLGRQHMLVSPERIEKILQQYGAWPPAEGEAKFHAALLESPWRFDVFAGALGAKKVESCDVSDYEGATLIHDLNQVIPPEWEERFDAVIDGGALEHVFNFPVAIANCMKMVKTGGHLILFTPANNYFGHGFYQFSPELFFRVLSRENGFEVNQMVVLEDNIGMSSILGVAYPFPITGPWYSVHDPAEIQSRVTLINHKSAILMVLAKKISRETIFAKTPQQSDYVPQWQATDDPKRSAQPKAGSRVIGWLRSRFSESFCREVMPKLALLLDPFRLARFRRIHSFRNRKFYKRVDE